jgi:hypothetical protein
LSPLRAFAQASWIVLDPERLAERLLEIYQRQGLGFPVDK